MAAANQLGSLLQLLQGINGQSQTTKTSGGTQTQQTQLSDAAVQEQIKRILAGSGGVRDIGNSARKSGLYNSTSEELLLGNLYATAANQGEIARAPIVTTSAPQTSTTKTEGTGLGATAGLIGGAALLNSVLSSDVVGNGVQSLLGSIGLGSSSGSVAGQSKKTNELDFGNGTVGFGVGPDSAVGISGSAGSGGWSGDTFGAQVGQGLAGGDSLSGNVGASGNISAGKDDGFDLVGSIGSALSGFFTGGGLGGLVGAVTGGTGAQGSSGGGTSGGSVICTALKEKGLLDKELHAAGSKYLNEMNPITVIGYQIWGNKIAAKISEGHEGWTKFCLPIARSRTSLLATSGSFMDHVKHPLGTITKFIGEPICAVIGSFVPPEKFTAMYTVYANQKSKGV